MLQSPPSEDTLETTAIKEIVDLPKEAQEFYILRAQLQAMGRHDPVFFAKYFLGIDLNDFQVRFMRLGTKQNLVVCGNQVGKTVAVAVLHIWHAFYKINLGGDPDMVAEDQYNTLNISPVGRQAKNAFKYVVAILSSSFTWELEGKRYVNQCKIEWFLPPGGAKEYQNLIKFENKSVFYCVSTHQDKGASIQGDQFGYISYDECVQSHHLKAELDARIFSRIARLNGRLDLISTPDDQAHSQQYWYNLYSTAKRHRDAGTIGEWALHTGYYDDNKFIPYEKREQFKVRMKRRNPILYRQVVLGDFAVQADRMFLPEMIQSFWNDELIPTEPEAERKYVISVDWGVADQGDATVMKVLDYTDIINVVVVDNYEKVGGDPIELMAMLQHKKLHYESEGSTVLVVLDVASLGGQVFRKMLLHLKPIGFPTQEKANALTYFQIRLRNNLKDKSKLSEEEKDGIKTMKSFYIHEDENQLAAYKIDDKRLKQDNVMVLAQLAWFLDKYLFKTETKTISLKIKTGQKSPVTRGRRSARLTHNSKSTAR